MPARYIKQIIILSSIIVFFTGVSHPCGPFLPNRVLEQGDDYVLKPPEGYFYNEIELIRQSLNSHFDETKSAYKTLLKYKAKEFLRTEKADVNDLKDALGNSKDAKTINTLKAYEDVRQTITVLKAAQDEWKWRKQYHYYNFDEKKTPFPTFNVPEIPSGLPGEFEDYIRGAIFYHQEQLEKAKAVWERLLQRPAAQRKFRSTWAAFMIGRILVDSQPEESIKWFELTRELADKGFVDSLGLASSSIGWQARVEMDHGNYAQAMELYIAQLETGDRSAALSLQMACAKALKNDSDVLKNIAINSLARRIVTSFIFSRGGMCFDAPSPDVTRKWLKAIESAKINNVEEAGRFAWAAYSMGDTAAASKWVSKAPQDDIMAQWINAKLLLHEGKITDAVKQLVQISRIIVPNGELNNFQRYADFGYSENYEIKKIRGELGTLYLSQKHYIEALDTLIRGGYWEDAAYIAERILKVDELKTYIDKTWPQVTKDDYIEKMQAPDRLRYLFARRLARLNRWKEAKPYYPLKWQNEMDSYSKALQDSKNQKLSKTRRASALWKAAVIARYEGMELMGTELEQDWFIYDGSSYRHEPMPDVREDKLYDKITSSSSDEILRTKQTIPPDKRFHYRYIAAEYAWQAAQLMPDNSDQTARVLCIAGSWIMVKDSANADKFYKAMVNRNRKTKLGQEADKLRWFPNITVDGDALLNEVNYSL